MIIKEIHVCVLLQTNQPHNKLLYWKEKKITELPHTIDGTLFTILPALRTHVCFCCYCNDSSRVNFWRAHDKHAICFVVQRIFVYFSLIFSPQP